MAEEALSSLEGLLTSIPRWIAELEGIVQDATTRQRDMLAENQAEGVVETSPRRLRKPTTTSSMGTMRDDNDGKGNRRSVELLRPQLPHLTNSDALRLSQRNRKTATAASGIPSGRQKYRTESLIVIYYDGDVQKRFEQLVRSIAASRNMVRKGKMGARVDALTRTGSSSSEGERDSGDEATFNPKSFQPSRTTRLLSSAFGRDDSSEAFDRVDSQLDKGQAQCERAAHQILRDGDCNTELVEACKAFKEAINIVESELPGFRRRAARATERQRRSDERQRRQQSNQTATPSPRLTATRPRDPEDVPIMQHAMPPGQCDSQVLEVDDSDSDEEMQIHDLANSFQMSKISSFRRGPPSFPRRAPQIPSGLSLS